MSTSNMFTMGSLVLPSGQIYGQSATSVDPQIQTVVEHGDGVAYDQFAAVMFQSPMFSIATKAINNALGLVGLNGLAIAAATDFWIQKFTDGGVRTTGTNSQKHTFSKGLVCLRNLSVEDRGVASLGLEGWAVSSDGVTAPLTVTGSAAMTAPTMLDELFTLGPIKINGTAVGGVKSLNIDFGLQVMVESGDGDVYPSFVTIQAVQPKLTFRTLSVQKALSANIGQFAAQGATDSVFYLRKLAKNGARVADATTEHISFTLDDGLLSMRPIEANGRNPAMVEYLFEPTWDAVNDVLAIARGVAVV